jgi:PleD family two-component response regulator
MDAPRILLIDPFKNLLNAYQMILEEEQYLIDTVFNLQEAAQLCDRRFYSVIITEYIPPFEATDDLIQWMNMHYPETYIIMVTNATIDEETYEKLFALGVGDILLKPYPPAKILVHIRKGLKQREFIQRQQLLEKLNLLEPITERIEGLIFNARFLKKCLRQEIKKASRHHHPLSLLLIETPTSEKTGAQIDFFYPELLRLLKKNTREEDLIGKDNGEIGIILPETDHPGSEALAQRLFNIINEHHPFKSDDFLRNYAQTISFQSFTYPEKFSIPEPLRSVLEEADKESAHH